MNDAHIRVITGSGSFAGSIWKSVPNVIADERG